MVGEQCSFKSINFVLETLPNVTCLYQMVESAIEGIIEHIIEPIIKDFNDGKVRFQIFPWCLKAKFQMPPLHRRMFVINTTTVPRFVSVWQLASYFLTTTWLAGEISGVWLRHHGKN